MVLCRAFELSVQSRGAFNNALSVQLELSWDTSSGWQLHFQFQSLWNRRRRAMGERSSSRRLRLVPPAPVPSSLRTSHKPGTVRSTHDVTQLAPRAKDNSSNKQPQKKSNPKSKCLDWASSSFLFFFLLFAARKTRALPHSQLSLSPPPGTRPLTCQGEKF